MRKETVKFYNDSQRYTGWQYIHNTSYAEIESWVRSGNSCQVGTKWLYCIEDVTRWKNTWAH
jgi:hypothetical protein